MVNLFIYLVFYTVETNDWAEEFTINKTQLKRQKLPVFSISSDN